MGRAERLLPQIFEPEKELQQVSSGSTAGGLVPIQQSGVVTWVLHREAGKTAIGHRFVELSDISSPLDKGWHQAGVTKTDYERFQRVLSEPGAIGEETQISSIELRGVINGITIVKQPRIGAQRQGAPILLKGPEVRPAGAIEAGLYLTADSLKDTIRTTYNESLAVFSRYGLLSATIALIIGLLGLSDKFLSAYSNLMIITIVVQLLTLLRPSQRYINGFAIFLTQIVYLAFIAGVNQLSSAIIDTKPNWELLADGFASSIAICLMLVNVFYHIPRAAKALGVPIPKWVRKGARNLLGSLLKNIPPDEES